MFTFAPPQTIDSTIFEKHIQKGAFICQLNKKGSLLKQKNLRLVSSFCTTSPLTADLSVVVFDHQSDSQSMTMFGMQLDVMGFASTLIDAHDVFCV